MNTPEDVKLDKGNCAIYKTWILAGLVGSSQKVVEWFINY